jgi:hypothetical protein
MTIFRMIPAEPDGGKTWEVDWITDFKRPAH